jgi:hypothetical protein
VQDVEWVVWIGESEFNRLASLGDLSRMQKMHAEDKDLYSNWVTGQIAGCSGHQHVVDWLREVDRPCPRFLLVEEFIASWGRSPTHTDYQNPRFIYSMQQVDDMVAGNVNGMGILDTWTKVSTMYIIMCMCMCTINSFINTFYTTYYLYYLLHLHYLLPTT